MMKIQEDGGLAQPSDMRMQNDNIPIKTVEHSAEEQEMMTIVREYSTVFDDIRQIYDRSNEKEIYGQFNTRPDAALIAQTPRQISCYLQESFKKWELGNKRRHI